MKSSVVYVLRIEKVCTFWPKIALRIEKVCPLTGRARRVGALVFSRESVAGFNCCSASPS